MLKICLRYRLHMMGVPILGLSYIYRDNMSVIHNMQHLESTLKKKSMKSAIMQFANQLQWVKADLVML